ncbi:MULTISPECIES: pseudouridine synthase [Nostocales]|uniref:pseudouridine synthase n=1 Tax=Nostocales TaxID=1161 RepID=UPI0016834B25|nr:MULTISPECIES: pseudouridine synthase [Nostocales]MBD2302411.1 rRNA pseudouridine synthase [Nostoc sp. FACHB-190]MBD2486908.1 rRNA pseudouridine synthase [Aulosira sp. FACHB-615]
MEVRLQKALSQLGIASRREAEEMIRQSRVQVNGVVANLGQKVNTQEDAIAIDGKLISAAERPPLIYLLLNKPPGVVSTCADPQGRKTVLDLLPKKLRAGLGIHPVGRLDAESTGALILTNDGELTFGLTHPRHSIPKTYRVVVKGHPSPAIIEKWSQGVILDGRKTLPAQVNFIESSAENSCLEIVLKEGRNRQIRRVAEILGHPVIKLHRTAIGTIQLKQPKQTFLCEGQYRYLSDAEIRFLHNSIKGRTIKDSAEGRSKVKS